MKPRRELPPFKKLNVKFDIERLRSDLQKMQESKSWDGLTSEYEGLCETHQQLPPFFIKEQEDLYNSSYKQLALSEFDTDYDMRDADWRENKTFWENNHPHRNVKADERYYRKPVEDIPEYLGETLNYFRPFLHRVRFAKLSPQSQVKPHIDYDTKYSIRLHIPIVTNENAKMGIEYKGESHEEHWPADGSVYFINQGFKHWATNPSDSERVHLILSIESQKFLEL